MTRRILVIDGHPDSHPGRLCHAIAHAYADGAGGSHSVKQLTLAHLNIPPLSSREEWEAPGTGIVKDAQEAIGWAEHLVIIYPLWLGAMPATLKAFLEQVLRPGFAISQKARSMWPGLLKGKSARIIVTMGMPGFIYRWYFGAYTLKSLDRNILRYSGIAPVRSTIFGNVEGQSAAGRNAWLEKVKALGESAR